MEKHNYDGKNLNKERIGQGKEQNGKVKSLEILEDPAKTMGLLHG